MTLHELVDKYMECGKKFGFAIAECILSKYTDGVDNKCCNVSHNHYNELSHDLENGVALGPVFVGQQVKMIKSWPGANIYGTISGKTKNPSLVKVIKHGNKTPQLWARKFWEPA